MRLFRALQLSSRHGVVLNNPNPALAEQCKFVLQKVYDDCWDDGKPLGKVHENVHGLFHPKYARNGNSQSEYNPDNKLFSNVLYESFAPKPNEVQSSRLSGGLDSSVVSYTLDNRFMGNGNGALIRNLRDDCFRLLLDASLRRSQWTLFDRLIDSVLLYSLPDGKVKWPKDALWKYVSFPVSYEGELLCKNANVDIVQNHQPDTVIDRWRSEECEFWNRSDLDAILRNLYLPRIGLSMPSLMQEEPWKVLTNLSRSYASGLIDPLKEGGLFVCEYRFKSLISFYEKMIMAGLAGRDPQTRLFAVMAAHEIRMNLIPIFSIHVHGDDSEYCLTVIDSFLTILRLKENNGKEFLQKITDSFTKERELLAAILSSKRGISE